MISSRAVHISAKLRALVVAKLGAREIGAIVCLLVGAALLLSFWLIAEAVAEGDTSRLDKALLMFFRTPNDRSDLLGPPWFEEVMRDITALGSYSFIIIVVAAAVGYLLLIGKRKLALGLFAAEAGGMLISNLLKMSFDRPRPDLEQAARVFTSSFPSGHATLSAVTFLTLGALLTRVNGSPKVKTYFIAVAVFLTLTVGVSRVYLGVHYPSDILAGWCIGAAWATICWGGALWLQRHGAVEKPTPLLGR